jgi:hypothetical protein
MNMNITKQLKTKIVALKAIGQRKEYIFLAFFVELGIMAKTNYKDTIIPHGQLEIWYHLMRRLGPDLLRGTGKSIVGDLDIDEEGSEQNFEPLLPLHHYTVGYQSVQHELTSPRRLIPSSAIENPSKNEEDAIWIVDEWLSSQVGGLQTVKIVKLFLAD